MDIGLPKSTFAAASPVVSVHTHLESGKLKSESPQVSSTLRVSRGFPRPPSIPPGWRPGMPIPMPLGWKPGDPIPLPLCLEIPPLPPDWKPGDAVMLPPAVAASRPHDQAIPAKTVDPPQPVPSPPAGVIHVPSVQLDLNPELEEDYGSEYSDELRKR